MTQEDKEIILKDLSARLPYGVKIKIIRWDIDEGMYINTTLEPDDIERLLNNEDGDTEIKPYLRPLSSMTDKELTEFLQINGMNLNSDELKTFRRGETAIVSTLYSYSRHIDWLNANHFDYRGLIEKSLALDATGLNIY